MECAAFNTGLYGSPEKEREAYTVRLVGSGHESRLLECDVLASKRRAECTGRFPGLLPWYLLA